MKFRLTFLLIILVQVGTFCQGQRKNRKEDDFKPFTILLINADSAQIPDTLLVSADSIEATHIGRYYRLIRMMEATRDSTDEQRDSIELNALVQKAKSNEMDAYDFKYYHILADRTLYELENLFNTNFRQNNWATGNPSDQTILEGSITSRADLFTYDLEKLGKHYSVDYIIAFENVRTDSRGKVGVIKYTLTLFWAKANKIILSEEIEGNALGDNYKLLQEIYPPVHLYEKPFRCDNYLECMFKSAIRFGTEKLFTSIRERQKK